MKINGTRRASGNLPWFKSLKRAENRLDCTSTKDTIDEQLAEFIQLFQSSTQASNSVQQHQHRKTTAHDTVQIQLLSQSSPKWCDYVIHHFDPFLVDHAACERKASAVATSMICHYPDKRELVMKMADLAVEEMVHYREVLKIIAQRDLALTPDQKDPYVNALRQHIKRGQRDYFLDRLLIAGLVEARGTERFAMISVALTEPELKSFYTRLAESEARHQQLFLDLALLYVDQQLVTSRLAELQVIEAEIIDALPIRAALH